MKTTQVVVPLIVRRSQLKEICGISPSTVNRLMDEGRWPQRIKYSQGIVGWDGQAVVAAINDLANNSCRGE